MARRRVRWAVLTLLVLLASCATSWRAQFSIPPHLIADPSAPFLKLHTHAGHVIVLANFDFDDDRQQFHGRGRDYDVHRTLVAEGDLIVPAREVVLAESNQPERILHSGVIVLGVVTAASLALSAVCLASPKTCFGSCPTFYADPAGPIVAEGFSQSFARTLEESDVDALPEVSAEARRHLSLWMKNEALETHVVRQVRLLAVPTPNGERVVRAGTRFFPVQEEQAPTSCLSAAGDCLEALRAPGGAQYLSQADPEDLGTKESLEIAFANRPVGDLGVTVRARSSLLETYVFYQLLAYLGLDLDEWMLRLEAAGESGSERIEGLVGPLQHIDIEVHARRGWEHVGAFHEVGPLAWDEVVLPLDADLPPGPVRLRLVMAKGAWKIDRASLVSLGPSIPPAVIAPAAVQRDGAPSKAALESLAGSGPPLVTYPGDVYRLDFTVPPGDPQLFLESRGFYYEWVRSGWLPEASDRAVLDALRSPEETLRHLAPAYHQLEPQMESLFQQSRVGTR